MAQLVELLVTIIAEEGGPLALSPSQEFRSTSQWVCFSQKFSQVLISSPASWYSPSLTVILVTVGRRKGRSRCSSVHCHPQAAGQPPPVRRGDMVLFTPALEKSKEEVKDSFPLFTMGPKREGGLAHFKIKFYSEVSWMCTQKCVRVHSSVIYNCKKVEKPPMSVHWCVGE